MAKKLSDIAEYVNSSNESFDNYLKDSFGECFYKKLTQLSSKTELMIFSGVIRNFFIKIKENRDIDIVLNEEIDLYSIFDQSSIKTNSFGGAKIFTKNFNVDLWYTKDTWAYNYQKVLDFDLDVNIPSTAFFNFSSVIYSFNKKKFYYTVHFLRFLRDKELDVVYKPNYNFRLCIINSLYYAKKYNLKISKKLQDYIQYLHSKNHVSYKDVQLKHFGEIIFTDEEVEKLIKCSI